ncbi:MAG: class I SAM-dependent methyltransferase [Acidobacteriota bacterium]
MSSKPDNLSITALYTAQTWSWGGFDCAQLLETRQGRGVFNTANLALGLARLLRPGLPSLPCSLVQRHAMIDHLLAASGSSQVLELAAGLSRRGAAFSRDPAIQYVEVDLPPMVEQKRTLLARSEQGLAVLNRSNLRMIGADIASVDLDSLVKPGRSLMVIAEGLLMYLKAEEQRQLWRRVSRLIRRVPRGVFLFDLVPACELPPSGWIGRALGAAFKQATGGRSFETDKRTRQDILRELQECGFGRVATFEPQQVGEDWQLPHSQTRTQALIFQCQAR